LGALFKSVILFNRFCKGEILKKFFIGVKQNSPILQESKNLLTQILIVRF
jgi:hypothetical protein